MLLREKPCGSQDLQAPGSKNTHAFMMASAELYRDLIAQGRPCLGKLPIDKEVLPAPGALL